jgi:hypothetical protein
MLAADRWTAYVRDGEAVLGSVSFEQISAVLGAERVPA